MRATKTIRDGRGVTRFLDVAPGRRVRWWYNASLRLWTIDVVSDEEFALSHGAAYCQADGLDRAIESAKAAIEADPSADQFTHY